MGADVKSNIDSSIGKVFKAYRKKHRLTQDKMAEKLEISEKYISRLENGNSGVKLETLVNYMNILGIAPNVVFKDLITNKDAKFQVDLSYKISQLPEEKIVFLDKLVDNLESL